MKTIIHGNDLQKSRDFFYDLKSKIKSNVLLNGDKITYDDFFNASEGNSLFEPEKTVLVENFFSNNKASSIEFKKIIEYINSRKDLEIIFWENSEVSKASLNSIKNAEIKSFVIPSVLFVFLDSLKPENYKVSISLFNSLNKLMEKELIFFMLVRQFRLLLNIASNSEGIDETKRLAPWQASKLRAQSKAFGREKLEALYKKLFEIENNHKTGKVGYEISKSIDFFLLDL